MKNIQNEFTAKANVQVHACLIARVSVNFTLLVGFLLLLLLLLFLIRTGFSLIYNNPLRFF